MDKFKITKDEYTTRTLRFPKELWERISQSAQHNEISANALIIQAITFALERMDDEKQS